mgnify:CR=1 FL=1
MFRRLEAPGALDNVPFGNNKVKMLEISIEKNCPIKNIPLTDNVSAADSVYTLEKSDTTKIVAPLPPIRDSQKRVVERLDTGEPFFEIKSSIDILREQVDSLKKIISVYEEGKGSMPNIDEDLLNLIKFPQLRHRIELQNGTVVMGDILLESDSSLTLKTQIGKLVLKKEMVIKMDKLEKPGPKVVFIGEPFIDYYPNRQVFSGKIKNIGDIRADFVRVSGKLFDQTTSNVGIDSVFVKGARIVYKTNVVADTALEPGQIASYTLTVPIMKGRKPEYHTMDIHWKETR